MRISNKNRLVLVRRVVKLSKRKVPCGWTVALELSTVRSDARLTRLTGRLAKRRAKVRRRNRGG